jgi:hypothetical protein
MLFSEYTYSDISIDIILQIKKEESCFLSISICNLLFFMLRISEKGKALARFSLEKIPYFLIRQEIIPLTHDAIPKTNKVQR